MKMHLKMLSAKRRPSCPGEDDLTHWGRVTHIWVGKLTIIGSDNGLLPGWRQAIIWTNAGILLIRALGTNFSEILSEICASSFKKMHLKMLSAKWRPFCLGLNVLNNGVMQNFWPINGLSFLWSMGWGVLFSECLVIHWGHSPAFVGMWWLEGGGGGGGSPPFEGGGGIDLQCGAVTPVY